MLGLLGLQIFEATGADIGDLAKNTAAECCAYAARALTSSWCHCRPSDRPGNWNAYAQADPASTAAGPGWTATRPPAACGTSLGLLAYRRPRHTLICFVIHVTTMLDAGVDLRMCRLPPVTRTRAPRCGRARPNLDRHPNYILAADMASAT
jgi:integrase/recombinase XerD